MEMSAPRHTLLRHAPPTVQLSDGAYLLRFAQTEAELDDVMRLRFRVFNLELGEGLSESYLTGRDRDRFDETCDHMIVIDTRSGDIVGTYRMQTAERATHGWYSAAEFVLASLPPQILEQSIELGRACIDKAHRIPQVLFLLMSGIAKYMDALGKRYLFGCCSLASQDPHEGMRAMQLLEAQGALHPVYRVYPLPETQCYDNDAAMRVSHGPEIRIPKLFRAYLRFGATVLGPPAIDRDFQTIDFFILWDRSAGNAETARFFEQKV
jgi:putative hemolysin